MKIMRRNLLENDKREEVDIWSFSPLNTKVATKQKSMSIKCNYMEYLKGGKLGCK